ncbi:hypothetical protein INS49_012727 [Diaporthe citri]|uniref:uncharacterized protein n=1 Tax=Diaporthe citri TaxID=83186 RepID=UPI001C80CF9A|nr:uncharacterized protein INS49_012727 [Diaporthe citri]KAG6359207.1 hypothetical protein INS49_012727 [Diaporthe citri]
MIDHEGIARFAVAAFMGSKRFKDAEIAVFSQVKNPGELMEMLGKATGRTFGVEFMSAEEIKEGGGTVNPLIMGTKWGFEMTGFNKFLERE